jgi:hypothetical protein
MNARFIGEGFLIATAIGQSVALYAMIRTRAYKTYPAFFGYLAVSLLFCVTLGFLPYGPHSMKTHPWCVAYTWGYWATYLVSTALLFLTIQTVFRQLMSPLPGLSRLGVLMFRWVVAISFIVALSSSYMPTEISHRPLYLAFIDLMRCVSVLELCLLAFVTLVAQKVGLSYRSLPFGLSLGFGISAALDFIQSAIAFHVHTVYSGVGLVCQAAGIAVFGMWAIYFWKPEPERAALPTVSSSLLRWNDVALALGNAGAQMPPAPAPEFFLSDVEKVVERVLVKNSLKATQS